MLARLRRLIGPAALICAATASAVLAAPSTAMSSEAVASGVTHISCTHVTPSAHQRCDARAGISELGGSAGSGGDGGSTGGGANQVCHHFAPAGTDCFIDNLGWWDGQDSCWYHLRSGQTEPGEPGSTGGALVYDEVCQFNGGNGHWLLRAPEAAILATPPFGYGGTDDLAVAADAINHLTLDAADIGTAPLPASAGGAGLVGLPVWLWTVETPTTWGPTTATASVPGLSVTATATAQQITWDMGDGHHVVCASPGTPWGPSGDGQHSPDCGYRYATPSRSRPGSAYTVTATTTFLVTWRATDGATGFITLQAVDTTALRINELEVLLR